MQTCICAQKESYWSSRKNCNSIVIAELKRFFEVGIVKTEDNYTLAEQCVAQICSSKFSLISSPSTLFVMPIISTFLILLQCFFLLTRQMLIFSFSMGRTFIPLAKPLTHWTQIWEFQSLPQNVIDSFKQGLDQSMEDRISSRCQESGDQP